MNFCILTSKSSWFYLNKRQQINKIFKKNIKIFTDPKKINSNEVLCFVLSYYKIIPKKYLNRSLKFMVNHESNLPANKGFSPLFWQILQKKKKITSTLFIPDPKKKVDTGEVILKKNYYYDDTLLYDEIKSKQFENSIDMIKSYFKKKKYNILSTKKTNFLKRRAKIDSELNINKSLKSQFDLLRICDNKNFPAFFKFKKKNLY